MSDPLLITLETDPSAPSSIPDVLKKIMEMPPPNILDGDDGKGVCLNLRNNM